MDISIIISTLNRAESLGRTLDSFNEVEIPDGAAVEILVVDNASTDDTPAVTKNAKLKNFQVRYLHQGSKGKCKALNTSLAQAQGQVLLFTDDDVVPAKDWLVGMTSPLMKRDYDALAGRIELAPNLIRPWMTDMHQHWLAASCAKGNWPVVLVGASMGIHRDVLKRVPAFDVELGPAGLGCAEDVLFSWQLEEAGFRIGEAANAKVVHYFDNSRLANASWMNAARNLGRSEAYLWHHWFHRELKWPWLQRLMLSAKLHARRRLQRPLSNGEGAPTWEMSYVFHIEKCRQYNIERKRVRNYEKRGLIKRQNGVLP